MEKKTQIYGKCFIFKMYICYFDCFLKLIFFKRMVHPNIYFSTSCQCVSWQSHWLKKTSRAIWPPREKHFSGICLFLCLVGISFTFHFLLALSDFCPHLCNLPQPKRVPERSLCSKIGINDCFQRESRAFDRIKGGRGERGSCGLYSKGGHNLP